MTGSRPILRAGLTGGVASGKTTVAHILAELGAYVLDADAIAHHLMRPGTTAHAGIVAHFGREILDEEGRISRAKMARLVFHDAGASLALNAIVHPQVRAEAARRITQYAPQGRAPIDVFDAALLVETGIHRDFHRLIVACSSRETQVRRLLARDRMSTEDAEARIASQAPLDEKLALADYVVDTEGTLRETRRQTERIYAAMLSDFEQEFGPPKA